MTSSAHLRKRYRAERRYRFYGKAAIAFALCFLVFFFATIVSRALPAFSQYEMLLKVDLPSSMLEQERGDQERGDAERGDQERGDAERGDAEKDDNKAHVLSEAEARRLLDAALARAIGGSAPRRERRARRALLTPLAAFVLIQQLEERAQLSRQKKGRGESFASSFVLHVALSSASERFLRNRGSDDEALLSSLSVMQRDALEALEEQELVVKRFNVAFFSRSDSRVASSAGIRGALLGSFWALLTAFLLAFPLGLLTAVHLQEFAPRNRLTVVLEVAIYNLAAVPSIVFGLLGLAVLLNWWQLPRSAPLTGGMVLALMTLPTVVVAARSALAAVTEDIRNAGLALGASHSQTVLHHVLPQAMPGILTGTIIGMARALGETAPLLMIGMVAFVAQAPTTPLDPATALPVQIFLWADHPDPAFSSRAAAAILVMLVFLIAMNATAVLLRGTFERKRQK